MPEKTFYITTPIYYVNDVPHVGNSSTTVAADVISRFKRLQGRKVLFATGTDEHALKVLEVAQSRGMSAEDYVDSVSAQFEEIWRKMHITYDVFIRTTEPRHKNWSRRYSESSWRPETSIRMSTRAGTASRTRPSSASRRSSTVCVQTWNAETRALGGGRELLLRLSAYGDRLLKYFEENPDTLGPEFRKNEVISFIKAGLKDACVTRKAYGWGIPVPDDPDQSIYVWFDALLNYLTVAGYLQDEQRFAETWPVDMQLMGKGILSDSTPRYGPQC